MTEQWNLYLDCTAQATPWPWAGKTFADLTGADLASLPEVTRDFLRYSPTDGPIDRVQVPGNLPREEPVCRTSLAFVHDTDHLYVFIMAERPGKPVPELADCPNEDFSVVIPSRCAGRGLYFGMNQAGESIGCSQIWDPDIPFDESDSPMGFSKIADEGVAGPSGWRSGRLDGMYVGRLITLSNGCAACFQIDRSLFSGVLDGNSLRISAARVCYATGEWVSWGAPIIWSARHDLHGAVRFVESAQTPALPVLSRLDLAYVPENKTAELQARWVGVDGKGFERLQQGNYKGYADKVTFALNGREVTVPLAASTRVPFVLPDGWNRLEVMTAAQPVQELSFQKMSGKVIQSALVSEGAMPSLTELRDAFVRWHEGHEKNYAGDGIWGEKTRTAGARPHCLCHAGIFHLEPYLVASRVLGRQPDYDQRIRETCARMLAEQRPGGWFPCYCSANTRDPELGDGGAFTNGSVGEGLVLAAELLGEKAWLVAAERAADYAWYRWECNQNYAAFALWHLAALIERNQQARWLDRALYLARNFVVRDIGLSGAQGGHNYFSAYGNITLKGMARLLSVLPAGHDFHNELKDKTIRFANQILSRQQPSGLFAGRNRKYLGYHHPVPGLFFVAEAIPEQAKRLELALAAMTRAMIQGGREDASRKVDSDSGLVLALAMKSLHRQA
jgi:hypothetical protein